MHVLGQMVAAVKPGGQVFDLQVIRPNPVVEVDRRGVYEIDGEPLFINADAATAAVDDLVCTGVLIEEAIDLPRRPRALHRRSRPCRHLGNQASPAAARRAARATCARAPMCRP